MQVQVVRRVTPHRQLLHKAASLPTLNNSTPSSPITLDTPQSDPQKMAIRWVLTYHRKITRDTQYLAIAYLNALSSKGIIVTHENYEAIAMTTLLIAGKMNEIYPPKISSMLARCHSQATKEEVIAL